MKHTSVYVDIAFCAVLLPLLIIAFPVERWWATAPLYFCLFVAWLYATYFLFRYYVIPSLLRGKRNRTSAIACIIVSLAITAGFSTYKITSPYYHLRQQYAKTAKISIPVWGARPNQQAVWLHYIIVVMFSFAVGIVRENRLQPKERKSDAVQRSVSSNPAPATKPEQRQIMLKSDYKNVPVSVDSIEYIESIGNYVKFHLIDGRHLMSKTTLSNTLDLLPQAEFLRIHRSFVVANRRINKFSGTKVFIGEKDLPIGKTYAETVMNILREQASQNC
ncbi:MAG: LytR/AlgR family response regulator transcription factor [Muribaculaceae bacterium]